MNNDKVWSICLIVSGILGLITGLINLLDVSLSDVMIRILGCIELVLLPVLVYTSIKKFKR